MKLKDYIHLYLGCECQTDCGIGILHNLTDSGSWAVHLNSGGHTIGSIDKDLLLPILRPLSDMNEEEQKSFTTHELLEMKDYSPMSIQLESMRFFKLLQWRFDMFELIENGLALDKTEL